MPLLIAHRGLINGPDSDLENSKDAIEHARSLGFDVEIDLWWEGGLWWLGHDAPTVAVDIDWIRSIDSKGYLDQHHAWIHAKNIDALYHLRNLRWEGHVFYHQNDDVVLTNTGYLWTYPGKQLTPLSICVMPEWTDAINQTKELDVFGFCSDYVRKIKADLD